jgi:hypothetical protein
MPSHDEQRLYRGMGKPSLWGSFGFPMPLGWRQTENNTTTWSLLRTEARLGSPGVCEDPKGRIAEL